MPVGPRPRRLGRWALRATGPVVLVFLLLRVVDYGELRDAFGDIRVPWALAALAAVQLVILLRTLRWIDIHDAFGLGRGSLIYQLRLSYATSMASLALPQIFNPFSRLVLLLQDGYRAQRAAAGAAIEKALELAAYVGFGLYGSIFLASTFGSLVWWTTGLSLLALGSGIALYLSRLRLSRLAMALIEKIPGIGEAAEGDQAHVAREAVSLNGPVWLRLLGWSLLVALAQATMLYFLSRSLGVGLSFQYMVALWGIVALSMLLPLSINGLGTREAILVVAFDAADKSTDAAVALGLLVLATVAVGSSPGAIEWLWRFLAGGGKSPGDAASQTVPAGGGTPTVRTGGEQSR